MNKDLLKLSDLTKQDLVKILNLADQMKFNLKHGLAHDTLKGKTLAMIFTKSSTRTRVSFEVGMGQLGGRAMFLSSSDIQLGRGESIEDTARVLSRYVDGIMIRTFAQDDVENLAKFSSVPVINGLTDYCHPCQILADLMTIREHYSTLAGLKVCYVGDGNNVCNSLIVGCLLSDMHISVATPKGFEPHPDVIAWAKGSMLELTNDPFASAKNADVVVTDVWASMGQESEAGSRREIFKDFKISAELMNVANPEAMVQHCLPAHKGDEIDHDVFEAHASEIFEEAENRLHVQKAVMALLMGAEEA